jgi:hypothetical protein
MLNYVSFPLFGCSGFPVWLKYVPGIRFRTDNEPFKARIIDLSAFQVFLLSKITANSVKNFN